MLLTCGGSEVCASQPLTGQLLACTVVGFSDLKLWLQYFIKFRV